MLLKIYLRVFCIIRYSKDISVNIYYFNKLVNKIFMKL